MRYIGTRCAKGEQIFSKFSGNPFSFTYERHRTLLSYRSVLKHQVSPSSQSTTHHCLENHENQQGSSGPVLADVSQTFMRLPWMLQAGAAEVLTMHGNQILLERAPDDALEAPQEAVREAW
jgi:hypothetical protein